jgi:flagellar FliL protein
MATAAKEAPAEAPAPAAGGPSTKILMIALIAVVFLLTIAVGLAAFLAMRGSSHSGDNAQSAQSHEGAHEGKEKKEAAKLPAQYLDLSPAFVVNLQSDDGAMRYLQVEAQVMTRDPKEVEAIKANMPRIRNALIMLFSQQTAKGLSSIEAKEALQKQALAQVQGVMKDETGSNSVEAIYFTNFVMQ